MGNRKFYKSKDDKRPAEQILSPQVLCPASLTHCIGNWAPNYLDNLTAMTLLITDYTSVFTDWNLVSAAPLDNALMETL